MNCFSLKISIEFHPSIHPLPLILFRVTGVHHHPLTFTPLVNLESVCGRKLENPERSHAHRENMQTPYRFSENLMKAITQKVSDLGFKFITFTKQTNIHVFKIYPKYHVQPLSLNLRF